MEENTMMSLEEFFEKYNLDAKVLTDKEQLKALKDIVFYNSVDKELEEMRYSKIPQENKTKELTEEHLNRIHNFELNEMNAQKNIILIKVIRKEKRKLKRKESFQKVIKIFKK